MALLQAIIFFTTLLSINASIVFTPRSYNSTTEWSIIRHIQQSIPLVIQSNNSLVHVLDVNDTRHSLHLVSTDFKPCKVHVELTYPSRYPRRATSLGNGKIVVWLLNYRFSPYRREGQWKFVVVEPRNCTYRSFAIRDTDPAAVDVMDVIGYEDTFDVVMVPLAEEEARNGFVYTYSDDGERVSVVADGYVSDLGTSYRPRTVHVQTMKPYDPSEGYLYLQVKREVNETLIKRLDTNLDTLEEDVLPHQHNHFLLTYSTAHDNFTICHYYYHNNLLSCSLRDTSMKPYDNFDQDYQDMQEDFQNLKAINVMNLPEGDVMSTAVFGTNYRVGMTVHLGVRGGESRTITPIGKIYCEVREIRSFEVEDNVYCVSAICDETVHTKCFDLENP